MEIIQKDGNVIIKELFPDTNSSEHDTNNNTISILFAEKCSLKPDALEAVKLDPAILEAQLTVEKPSSEKIKEEHSDSEKDASISGNSSSKSSSSTSTSFNFAEMLNKQKEALKSLSPYQFDLLMRYADTLRQQRQFVQKYFECAFCKNNGASVNWYSSHSLKDGRGRVKCPVLRSFRCPKCGASGDEAHTIKYCPLYTW